MNFRLQLDSETVSSIQSGEPLAVTPSTTVRAAIAMMQEAKSGSLLVCDGDSLCGIFTERDVLRIVAGEKDLEAPVEQFMTAKPVTVSGAETVGKAIQNMSQGGYRRLPIVDETGCAVGVVKVSHILRHLVEHFPEAVYNLPPTPNNATQEREGA